MMTAELKPVRCGCGGEAKVETVTTHFEQRPRFRIRCEKCNISTIWDYWSEAEAITAWNRAIGITHERAVEYLQSTGWMQDHDREMSKGTAKVFQSIDGYRCAKCFYKFETTAIPQYCPKCGARLEWE